jgi:predicted metal-dependent phosphoesterase TrpH
MLKVELHAHTADDPVDVIPHTTTDLIDRAAALGYDAVAITLHDRQLDFEPWRSYAADRRIVLIPGIERTIEGKHVLLLNFDRGVEGVETFADLAALKARADGLVVAPHPFFPGRTCLGNDLDRHAHLFDAVERHAVFTRQLDFNNRAEQWARVHGKPMVGNGDVHSLRQLGTTYSLVEAERDPVSICRAIAAGYVRVISAPMKWRTAVSVYASVMIAGLRPRKGDVRAVLNRASVTIQRHIGLHAGEASATSGWNSDSDSDSRLAGTRHALHGNTEQANEADGRRDNQRFAGQDQRQDATDKRVGKGQQDD